MSSGPWATHSLLVIYEMSFQPGRFRSVLFIQLDVVKGIAKNPASNSWKPASTTHYRAETVS